MQQALRGNAASIGSGGPAGPGAPLLELSGVRFAYDRSFTLEIESFTLREGARVALVGRNGAGKTTWLRLAAGLEAPAAGSRRAHREPLRLGFLRQTPYLFSGTVASNLAYPLALRRAPRAEIDERVAAMLARIELGALARRRSDELSGGERKRLALGRALIAGPELLLLDEPDAHLDRTSRRVIETLLRELPVTLLFTTHDLRFAHRLAGQVLHLRAGRVVPGVPENILAGRVEPCGAEAGSGTTTAAGVEAAAGTAPRRIRTAGGLCLTPAGAPAAGEVKVAIDPRSLVLSREPLDSSMLNRIEGHISAAHADEGGVWLEIATAGETLTAIITPDSYAHLGINLGSAVVVSFKASAVEVLDASGGPAPSAALEPGTGGPR